MEKLIKANDHNHLKELIKVEIEKHGYEADLNHIDTSSVTDMSFMFYRSNFNGDISEWGTSSVTDISYMFYRSNFNGDISKWDTSSVTHMSCMFHGSNFNGDISKWDLSKLKLGKEQILIIQELNRNNVSGETKTLCAPSTTYLTNTQVEGDHYKNLSIQPIEYIQKNNLGYEEGNIIKYISRYKNKGGVKDLEKAKQYLDFLIEKLSKI